MPCSCHGGSQQPSEQLWCSDPVSFCPPCSAFSGWGRISCPAPICMGWLKWVHMGYVPASLAYSGEEGHAPAPLGTALWGGGTPEHAGSLRAEVTGAQESLAFLLCWSQPHAELVARAQETSGIADELLADESPWSLSAAERQPAPLAQPCFQVSISLYRVCTPSSTDRT